MNSQTDEKFLHRKMKADFKSFDVLYFKYQIHTGNFLKFIREGA
jgi:hypothetical protein